MKKLFYAITAIVGLGLLGLCGCSKEGGTAGAAVDTAKVESAFQSAEAADKTEVQNAITAIKGGKYSDALASLQKAAASVKLTPEQKSALEALINEVKAKIGDAAKKTVDETTKAAKEGADKAATDLQKAVGK